MKEIESSKEVREMKGDEEKCEYVALLANFEQTKYMARREGEYLRLRDEISFLIGWYSDSLVWLGSRPIS
jgi:hypothetical protein